MRGRAAAAALALVLVLPAPPAVVAAPRPPAIPGAPVTAAPLPPPPGHTELVSQRRGGGFPAGSSAEPSVSANGRYVAFTSAAPDIVGGPAGAQQALPWVFVRDRDRDRTTRLPLPAAFGGGGSSRDPSISADGNVVAWTYQLPPGFSGAPGGTLVLAWDRGTGKTEVVSRNTKGAPAAGSREPSVSANGRYVAYTSDNPSISRSDTGPNPDVFRYDRRTKATVLVSVGQGGHSAGPTNGSPSISADGSIVAFQSDGGDVAVPENTGPGLQVYVRDIPARRTQRVSVPQGGGPANGPSTGPSISASGRLVAFESSASNLVPGDTPAAADVFLRDRTAGTTTLVSVTPGGAPGNAASGQAAISADGRMVSFASSATNLVAAAAVVPGARLAAVAPSAPTEVYERDVVAADTILVSVAVNGRPGGSRSLTPAVGGNGRFVAFASLSNTLVRGDRLKNADVFLRDFPPVPRLNPPVLNLGTRPVGAPAVPAATTLANAGWGPLSVRRASIDGPSDFAIAADACDGRVLHRAEACTVTVSFVARHEGPRRATLRIPDSFTGSPRTASLRGNGSQARLSIDPVIGPPGTVVIATGSGFPRNTQIALRWSTGITPTLPRVETDGSGRFRTQVLVFHNDQTGRRDLVATPVGRTDIAPVSARMLVTRPSVGPPGFSIIQRLIDAPFVLLLRG